MQMATFLQAVLYTDKHGDESNTGGDALMTGLIETS